MKANWFGYFLLFASIVFFSCKKEDKNKAPKVEAGSSQVVQLPLDSVKVSGVASDADGAVVAYLWSKISGPGYVSILSPGSASTTIKGLKTGSYVFQLMATDDKGATGVDTISIQVNPSLIQTVSFQPHNNDFETILAIRGVSNVSDNRAPEITAAAWTNGGDPTFVRSPFKFDLSTIPSGSMVLSAKLTLYSNHTPLNGDLVNANAGPDNSILIQRITSPWDKFTTWQAQPSTETENQVIIPHTNLPFLDLIDIDVTEMVKKMVGSNNYGFMVKLQNKVVYTSRIFYSSKFSDNSKHPKLVVTYQ